MVESVPDPLSHPENEGPESTSSEKFALIRSIPERVGQGIDAFERMEISPKVGCTVMVAIIAAMVALVAKINKEADVLFFQDRLKNNSSFRNERLQALGADISGSLDFEDIQWRDIAQWKGVAEILYKGCDMEAAQDFFYETSSAEEFQSAKEKGTLHLHIQAVETEWSFIMAQFQKGMGLKVTGKSDEKTTYTILLVAKGDLTYNPPKKSKKQSVEFEPPDEDAWELSEHIGLVPFRAKLAALPLRHWGPLISVHEVGNHYGMNATDHVPILSIAALELLLVALDCYPDHQVPKVSGLGNHYSPETFVAVKRLQACLGMKRVDIDGRFGFDTYIALKLAAEQGVEEQKGEPSDVLVDDAHKEITMMQDLPTMARKKLRSTLLDFRTEYEEEADFEKRYQRLQSLLLLGFCGGVTQDTDYNAWTRTALKMVLDPDYTFTSPENVSRSRVLEKDTDFEADVVYDTLGVDLEDLNQEMRQREALVKALHYFIGGENPFYHVGYGHHRVAVGVKNDSQARWDQFLKRYGRKISNGSESARWSYAFFEDPVLKKNPCVYSIEQKNGLYIFHREGPTPNE